MLARREPVTGLRRRLAYFEYVLEMLDALQVPAVVPPEVLVAGDKRSHSLDPERVGESLQPPGHCALGRFKSVSSFESVASITRGPWLLSQDRAHVAFSRR